ncbi:MAG: energy transducer TonB [Kiritimatiellae bacterium]|nr:energy transducer TonB [Kiritimatiellia bacterium]
MRAGELIASFLIHAAIIGSAAWFYCPPPAPQESVPIFFELVEESSLSSQQGSVPTPEITGTDPEIVGTNPLGTDPEDPPETPGTDPEIVGTDPPGTDPEDPPETLGTDPEIVGTDPEIAGTDPEIAGTDPEDEKEELKETSEIANKSDDIERARVVSDPVALNRIVPVYPRSARRKGHEGVVTVEISVAADGAVSDVALVSSSGHRELDEAASSAARSAHFAPATDNGECVSGRLRLTFDFRLDQPR